MRIFDCTTYYDEELMMDIRFNTLNDQVEKFIVVESLFSHSGNKKKLNFDINNYSKFKDKIIYIVIENEPNNLKKGNKLNQSEKRMNSLKRIEQSYDSMLDGIKDAGEDDLIILSDNDEIPNLTSDQFLNSKKNIIIFKQLLFYYKFNLNYENLTWFGSKACRKKKLKSMTWLRNLKNKPYSWWRLDVLFSNYKERDLEIINDGGWHFTNIKTPEKLYEKLKNFGHHDEFDESGIDLNFIKSKINNKEVFYDHFLDKKNPNKWRSNYKLKKVSSSVLPEYLANNHQKYQNWFD
tara:strand:- start:1492 stop:2370 length:879 start_codon:yes stop_codon:yes gene_type:complete